MSEFGPTRFTSPAESRPLQQHSVEEAPARAESARSLESVAAPLLDVEEPLLATQQSHGRVQKSPDDVQQLHGALTDRLPRSHRLLQPIERLPNEILSTIFLEGLMLDSGQAYRPRFFPSHDPHWPFVMAAACRWWRAVALNLARLWVCVIVQLRGSTIDAHRSFYIQNHLERSASLPLNVFIRHSDTRCPEPLFWPTITTLYQRARSFSFSTRTELATTIPLHLAPHAPHLVSLTFDDSGAYKHRDDAFHLAVDAPNLTHLTFDASFLTVDGARPYLSLTTVILHSVYLHCQDTLSGLFRHCPHLVHLEIYTSMELESRLPLTLHAEKLQSFKLDAFESSIDSNFARAFSFPSLRSADVSIHMRHGPRRILSGPHVTAFIASAFASVRSMTLRLSSPAGVALGLISCDQLEELAVGPSFVEDASRADWTELISILSTSSYGKWVCPHLRTFSLATGVVDEGFADSMIALARARRPAAPSGPQSPLQKINILYSHRDPYWCGPPDLDIDIKELQDDLDDILGVS